MKAIDVVNQLTDKLPKLSTDFTDQISVTSLTRSGSTVTAVTATVHGQSTGDYVNITGAKELNPISSLTFSGGVASATTTNNHDLTVPSAQQLRVSNLFDFNRATISGAVETEYNGVFTVVTAVNRKNFTYAVTGSPSSPATGSPVLEQELAGGYNGRHQVTVVDATSFTYTITGTPISPAGGTIYAETSARISRAISIERAIRSYTKQNSGKLWLFVVLGPSVTSRNRAILSDASQENSKQDEYRNRLIESFSIYVFVPAVGSLSGADLRDDIEDTRVAIFQSINGVVFPTALGCETFSKTTFLSDEVDINSNDAIYIHRLDFERVVDITFDDTVGPPTSSAFRDVDLDATVNDGTGYLDADIDLDDEPLP
jgi:hypothetical protein